MISPCVLLYLCGIVPSIWFLELKNFYTRNTRHFCNDQCWGELSKPGCDTRFFSELYYDVETVLSNKSLLKEACALEYTHRNERNFSQLETTVAPATSTTTAKVEYGSTSLDKKDKSNNVVQTIEGARKALDDLLGRVNIFNDTTWVLVLHQLLLFILIIGRWLLPKGEGISRDELLQLLLVFIGVGADTLEFVTETVKELSVRCDRTLIIFIMAFWSWSTLQFTLILTAAKARRSRAVGIYGEEETNASRVQSPVVVEVEEEEEEERSKCYVFCTNMEVWEIMSTLILQDGPFLAMRLYIMIGRKVLHQMIVFFTCKNLLAVILQIYRLTIIAISKKEDEEEETEELAVQKKLDTVKTLALAKSKFLKGLLKAQQDKANAMAGGKDRRSPKIKPVGNGAELPEA